VTARPPALDRAMARLRIADRRRRLARRAWFALGAAAFTLTTVWALAHTPIGRAHWGVAAVLTAVAGIAGAVAGRSSAVSDELLARSVDASGALPQLALTVVRPLGHSSRGLTAAVHGHTESQLARGAAPLRLPRLGIARWPAMGAIAAIILFLLLPNVPEIAGERRGHSAPERTQPETDGGDDDTGEQRGVGNARGRGPNSDTPEAQEQGGDTGEPEGPTPDQAAPQPGPTQPNPSQKPGEGKSEELYRDPDRLDVDTERLKIDSLFDEAIEGVKRTVMLPDPPKPKESPAERERPRGAVPDEIKRAEETALAERITDAAERDTVRRYYEYLNAASGGAKDERENK